MGYRRGTFFLFFLRVECLCFVELTFIYTLFITIQCILGNKHFNTYMRFEHQFLSVATYSTQTNVALNRTCDQHKTSMVTIRPAYAHSEHRFPAPSMDVVNQCLEFGPYVVCDCDTNDDDKTHTHTQQKTKKKHTKKQNKNKQRTQ